MAAKPAEAKITPVSENERLEVQGLAKDPVLRRAWLLHLAQKSLPLDQAIEWARTAEQFITGSTASRPALLQTSSSIARRERISMRETVLQLLRDNPKGLRRGEILERLHLKGDKTGETAAVSNALTALTKRKEIIRRERKYLIE